MARQYKLEVTRNGTLAELYWHDTGNLELTAPDTNAPADYLRRKLVLLTDIIGLMKEYGVTKMECTKV